MTGLPAWAEECYQEAIRLDQHHWPYVYGGGHNPQFAASIGLTNGSLGKGFDCSAFVSRILHAGHILDHPSGPLGTHELERWGASGPGKFVTVWVANRIINKVVVEHTVLEFHTGVSPAHRFAMGHYTHGPACGFSPGFDTSHYTARHKLVAP